MTGRRTAMDVISALAKVLLWSSGRRLEIAGLTKTSLQVIGREYHFHVVGKWGVEKWLPPLRPDPHLNSGLRRVRGIKREDR